MSDYYELRIFDTALLTFELTKGALGGYEADISSIEEPRKLLQLQMAAACTTVWSTHTMKTARSSSALTRSQAK